MKTIKILSFILLIILIFENNNAFSQPNKKWGSVKIENMNDSTPLLVTGVDGINQDSLFLYFRNKTRIDTTAYNTIIDKIDNIGRNKGESKSNDTFPIIAFIIPLIISVIALIISIIALIILIRRKKPQ